MAPMKRSRVAQDDGELEIVDTESASASLQPGPRKKLRTVSTDAASPGSDGGSDDDDDSFIEQATQYASMQRTKEKSRNLPAESGVIESVTCINFMCHKHFDVKLGPLINFITGHNGSGKSAILTAITICLGGKATSTNRGGSLKSFIMNGEDSAMLSVKLKNTSDGAYQPDMYGDSIIVERHFSRSGASGFKLKSATGRLISTRKGDLDDICDYFALQIDNPMNVLTQDMARQFLNNSSASEKYKFFMKGTQLEHLDGDYLIVEQNVDMIDADLWKKMQDVEIFKEEAQKAETLFRLSQRNDELRQRIKDLQCMMGWVQVEEQEQNVTDLEKDLEKNQENISRLQSESESLSEGYRQSNEANDVAHRHVDDAKQSMVPLQEEKAKVKAVHDQQKSEQMDLQTQQRSISSEIKATQSRVSKLESQIEEEIHRLSDADGGLHAERQLEIERKRQEAQEAKGRERAHEEEMPDLEERKQEASNNHARSRRPIEDKTTDIRAAESRLRQLEKDRNEQQSAFPASIPRLLAAIQQDNGFNEKPVGPLGSHVRLLKPEWSSILEKQFGSVLEAFIVTSKSDQSRLLGHMQRLKCVSTILIGNHEPIDTSGHEPDPEFDTSLRILEIDNDLVRKQLIIGQGIDQTILVSNRKNAVDLMNGTRLRNVKQCFTHNNKNGTGLRLAYGLGGGLSQSFVPQFQGSPRMKTDIEYQIRVQGELLTSLRVEKNELEQHFRETRSLVTQSEQAIVRHKRTLNQLRIESQRAQTAVEELQDALDQDSIEEGKLDFLRKELKDAQDTKAFHESSYEDSVNAKDQAFEALKATRTEMSQMDKSIEEAETVFQRAEARAFQRSGQRDEALREKNKAEDAVKAAQRETTTIEVEIDKARRTVEAFIPQAESFGPRMPVDAGETMSSLEKQYNKLEEDLQRAEHRLGRSQEEIADAAARAHEAFERAKSEAQSVEQLVQLLKTTLINRRERWRRFQKYITSRARIQFFYQLSERGFRGKLLANHKEKKLDLQVEPDETRANAKGRSTYGLSGGEKSFSTICLLLSMWEAMGAPVRCLDEFDVFMDSVNRDVSMEMLIRFARDSVGKQFILITPQNMGKVNVHDEDITVVKMRDPVRGGQQTIEFPVAA